MFPEFSSSTSLPDREQAILAFWKEQEIFRKTGEQTSDGPTYVFFEGPPTANGRPGIHHVLSRVFKDIYIRFHGQRGCHIPRRAGWDCHGLPVEREVEKQLGIKTKSEIEAEYGIAKFNELCRESVLKYVGDWNQFSERMAFWVDLDDPYFTMDNEFIESVWHLLKIIWEKGLIYQGYKVVPLDPVMGTTMSAAEVDLGYKETEDPSLTVRFRLADAPENERFGKNASFLVWTTTPWTLPSNVALALASTEEYLLIERVRPEGEPDAGTIERLICAVALKDEIFGEDPEANSGAAIKVVETLKGADLAGVSYRQILNYVQPDPERRAFYTITADFVTMDTGTGIVHIAPAYGADDLEVGNKNDLPVIHAVGMDGNFVEGTPHAGTFFKDADKAIVKELKTAGSVWKSERYKHNYPFGYRTGAPLLYFAKDAWYIRTTDLKSELIQNNEAINWVPENIKHGRFGDWLENNRDWALSRERYWGTPLPVWTDGEGGFRIIGSVAELSELAGRPLGDMDLHRPHVDEIEFKDPDTGKNMRRVPEVIDCWFDSGAMPYAQWGWPSGNRGDQLEKYFPADFISEAIDQTRGWFYTLLAISTMVSNTSSYKNVVCLGHVLDEKGEKMSKSKGNVVDPFKVFDTHGADAIRWYFLTNSPPGNSRRVGQPGSKNDPVAIVHGFMNMLINSVSFFTMYANIDGVQLGEDWENNPVMQDGKSAPPFAERPSIDRWILSALHQLIASVTEALEKYDCQGAGKQIEEFADSLSNWYIRRNRRRFWKGELDADKLSAYDTLYRCLTTLARLTAPFTPFLSEAIFRNLVSMPLAQAGAPESVQLAGWPSADLKHWHDPEVLREGDVIKQAAFLGRAARQESGVKVRQPLGRMMVHADSVDDRKALEKQDNQDVLLDELNVKQIEFIEDGAGILDYRVKANLPRIGKQLGPRVREVQSYLKDAQGAEVVRTLRAGEKIRIECADGEAVELAEEDCLIESISKEGVSGAEGGGLIVALDTTLTPDLLREGVARDLVRNVQELRKKSGLEVTDRIQLWFGVTAAAGQSDASGASGVEHANVASAIEQFAEFIQSETLSAILNGAEAPPAAAGELSVTMDGESVRIVIAKA
ncbi:MAG: isoleucine--tRNA ligase [bacterium]|nr:isoleucine--tRNA ligase [bacterium]